MYHCGRKTNLRHPIISLPGHSFDTFAVGWGTNPFTIFLGICPSQSYTLVKNDRLQVTILLDQCVWLTWVHTGETGTPPCSIWWTKERQRILPLIWNRGPAAKASPTSWDCMLRAKEPVVCQCELRRWKRLWESPSQESRQRNNLQLALHGFPKALLFYSNTCIKLNTGVVRPKKDSFHIANWDGHDSGRGAGSAGGTNRPYHPYGPYDNIDSSDGCAAANATPGSESFESRNSEGNSKKTCLSSKRSASLRSQITTWPLCLWRQ